MSNWGQVQMDIKKLIKDKMKRKGKKDNER